LLARDRWTRDRLLAHQQAALRSLLRDAAARSPYYRKLLGPPARAERWRLDELPTLPKATLMAEWDRVVADPRLRLAELEERLRGPQAGEPYLGEYRLFSTAGSTGVRGVFVYSEREFASWVAVCLRGMARVGVNGASRLVGIGAPSPLHMSKQLVAEFQSMRPGAPTLSVVTPLDELVAALEADDPDTVITYPSVAGQLAEEQLEGRLRIRPRRVMVVSEVLTAEVRSRIAQAWGIEPLEVYAATETALISSGSHDRVGMHVTDDFLIVEVVDDENRPVPPGEAGAKVLVTNLVNHTQPLIRYELSDSVTLACGPDPSGRPYTRIASVDGRSDDILRFPGRGGRAVAVHPFRLRAPFAYLPEVRQYQIVHRGTELDVRVVVRRDAEAGVADRVRGALLGELRSAGALAPAITVTTVPSIEREPGDAAKFKLIKAA
jgi:phenylacetate-coenzyme A ligase PaaK-like adenylate-forming protein